jgi:hypothetical protein
VLLVIDSVTSNGPAGPVECPIVNVRVIGSTLSNVFSRLKILASLLKDTSVTAPSPSPLAVMVEITEAACAVGNSARRLLARINLGLKLFIV